MSANVDLLANREADGACSTRSEAQTAREKLLEALQFEPPLTFDCFTRF